jgi:hypothetical protein
MFSGERTNVRKLFEPSFAWLDECALARSCVLWGGAMRTVFVSGWGGGALG